MAAKLKVDPSQIIIEAPFPQYAWPMVWGWIERFRSSVLDDYSPQTLEGFVEQQIAADANGRVSWSISIGAELGGVATFEPANPVFGYAHILFKKEFWGRSITLPAARHVARKVFNAGFQKIAMTPFDDNNAVANLIVDLGGVREGHLRYHTMRNGKAIGLFLYRLTPDLLKE